mmetsp:Transcript_40845/g.108267  ORF Transcript_40845/g.108267 Transcript_40845/m.108267 type:complete len:261 (-) Transcript_40845:352-1134(-)
MGHAQSSLQCCQQQALSGKADFTVTENNVGDHVQVHFDENQKQQPESHDSHWGCCRSEVGEMPTEEAEGSSLLESLSYVPARFDEGTTIDVERSQARYSKIVVHTRARTRRSKAWEQWLQGATSGREVTLLEGFDLKELSDDPPPASPEVCRKVSATYQLDKALSTLSILPADDGKPIALSVHSISVICPMSDFMIFFDRVEVHLDESEKSRAVLLQYVDGENLRRRVCFLEQSELAKEHCVQALTALWLEKRNDHSMWF